MRGRFARRLEGTSLSAIEAIAFQLAYEDDELAEWRERMKEISYVLETSGKIEAQAGSTNNDLS